VHSKLARAYRRSQVLSFFFSLHSIPPCLLSSWREPFFNCTALRGAKKRENYFSERRVQKSPSRSQEVQFALRLALCNCLIGYLNLSLVLSPSFSGTEEEEEEEKEVTREKINSLLAFL